MNNIRYMIKKDYEWMVFEGFESIKDTIVAFADYTGVRTPLFDIAVSGCDEVSVISMYNQFADSYQRIYGTYVLREHIYGDEN